MNDKPISTFDEICRITIDTMRKMELETLLQLKKQAALEKIIRLFYCFSLPTFQMLLYYLLSFVHVSFEFHKKNVM